MLLLTWKTKEPHARLGRVLQDLGATRTQQLSRAWRLQPYNHRELNSVHNLNELGSRLFLKASGGPTSCYLHLSLVRY